MWSKKPVKAEEVGAQGARPTMRAARLHRPGAGLTIDEIEKPTPRPTDVLVQVKACGVIPNLINVIAESFDQHSALHRPPLPAVYGLDAAGVVVEKGEQVHGIELGDRVYVNPLRYCGACRYCRLNRVEACPYGTLNGYFGLGPKSPRTFVDYPYGGYAEFMTAPQTSLVKLPDNVTFEMGARWGYIGTGYKALRVGGVDMNTTVLINGASGTLGLGATLFALALGAPKIMGIGRNEELLKRVKALAPDRIHVRKADGPETIAAWAQSLTDGYGADVVIDALPTGSPPESFRAALDALGPGGKHVNVSGVFADVTVNFLYLNARNQSLMNSYWLTTKDGQEMATLAGSGQVNLSAFEHERFKLEDVNRALQEVVKNRHGGFSNYVVCP